MLRTVVCCVCLAMCLTCGDGLAQNQGTGKNCVPATDGPAGPHCRGSQIGLCCDAAYQKDNCLTLVGATADYTCASFRAPSGPLSAFCCDEMDLPDCDFARTASDCVGDSNLLCCAHVNTGGQRGGTNCINIPYNQTGPGCPYRDRPNIFCCFGEIAFGLDP